eukprot:CAMPEP_0182572800 /NCGR_PEP_ID=MMETSP1324-20130603/17891_1 /TAXON_ID=236786 /ORGANISM="Florenciella sp., Strain RCC1587" /LENGTH=637 /DNA_ID=CAMNT_0024787809 /DNA_START=175 /DNA_END=2089 /DNA_ORIENTATION=+
MGTLMVATMCALPILLLIIRMVVKGRQSKVPSLKEIDPAILKVGGTTKKLTACNDEGVDVIVVGSGLGGLTSASLLSKAGYKVMVLEQHDVAGGCTHTFEDGGFEFDVGLHYIGGGLDLFLSPMRRMWAAASDGQLAWTKSDPDYDICYNSSTDQAIPFNQNPWVSDRNVLAAFKDTPGAKQALYQYHIQELFGVLVSVVAMGLKVLPPFLTRIIWVFFDPIWRRFGTPSVATVLDRCGMGKGGPLAKLGGALVYLYGDYGTNPARAPWWLHSLVSTHYYGGAFFPTGGSSSIAKTMVAAITRNGGHVFVRTPVSEIVLENGRAVGVKAKGVTVRAKVAVISDAGFRNTFGTSDAPGKQLVDPVVGEAQRALLQGSNKNGGAPDKVGAALCMVYLFVGLDKSDEELGIKARNVWALKDFDHDAAFHSFNELDLVSSTADLELDDPDGAPTIPKMEDLPAVFLGSASAKDGDWPRRNPGKSAMTVLVPVKAEWFDRWDGTKIKNRGDEYKAYKSAWKELMLEALYKHWPETKGHVVYTDVATPLSNNFYLNSTRGEVYGLEHTVERYDGVDAMVALHPQTAVPGLYMTGQDVLCVGIVSALTSGFLTTARVSYKAIFYAALEMMAPNLPEAPSESALD